MILILKAAVIGWAAGVTLGALGAGIAWATTEHGHRIGRNTL